MNIDSDAFIVAHTPEEAVDRLAALHRRATSALTQALKRYLKERIEPDAAQRALFRYPQLRLTYLCQGEVPSTVRAYAKVQVPGCKLALANGIGGLLGHRHGAATLIMERE